MKGRQTIKKIFKKCFICTYVNGKTLLGPATSCLPDFRIKCNHSFEFVGVDFAGPIYYKVKNSVYKAYLLLFTCGVTRASNIELAIDRSLHSVILALRRFLAKRGKRNKLLGIIFKLSNLQNYRIFTK